MGTPVYIPTKSIGYSHPKCYLSHTRGCNEKITGEHCISYNLLNKIEKNNKTINILGLTWLPKDKFTSIGKKNLVANVLCEHHNSALSPLDTAIGDLVEAIGKIDAEYLTENPSGRDYKINGSDIERWILKTIFGLIKSEQIKQKSGDPYILKNKCLELLCSPSAHWPKGWGLYVATSGKSTFHSSSFELIPHFAQETNEILCLKIKLNGIEMFFLMGKPNQGLSFGIQRPRKLIFNKNGTSSEIKFSWDSKKEGLDVIYSHSGTYSGISPDHDIKNSVISSKDQENSIHQ